ncbi:cAMP and cAMP-inhibited cGMP 3',5'-cyclic phosphodiesterase 10A-like [Gigantopelta aegis]|uniref:cAMP and cAMP-inhibited cGMP 3',5'-cyclic phosphodiesterase 10A-like n=1 Tax=Gigantopelta aegis TaxID=1735272 RepID=UPI001B88D910|nr:cAMP and cAMP-inhibited cGMP 3',5'-cyclic phosphodiesterase 10A-like [Gigantopelta aegis]
MGNAESDHHEEDSALSAVHVKAYLEAHPTFLYNLVQNRQPSPGLIHVPRSHLHEKRTQSPVSKQIDICTKECSDVNLHHLVYNEVKIFAKSQLADWVSFYVPTADSKDLELMEYVEDESTVPRFCVQEGTTVSAEAALRRTTLLVRNLPQETKYANGVGHPERDVRSVMAAALHLPSGEFLGVIELCRDGTKDPFGEDDMHLCNSYFGWLIIALHQATTTQLLQLQVKLNKFLLESSKKLFDDKISIDSLVENILQFTKTQVNADRCAMFLADEERKQLYAHYFDDGSMENERSVFTKKQHIRFPFHKGIAGHVYQTGEPVNIADAYTDERFNPEVDKQTGYRTKSILCMPIINKSRVVGVLQMVNSLSSDHFTNADENAFKTYAVYCALALHCSKLYDQINQSDAQVEVTRELMQYHIASPEDEAKTLQATIPLKEVPEEVHIFDFNAYAFADKLPQLFVYMLQDLFGKHVFELGTLCRFVLTVKKVYRPVAYHNWFHAMHVAQSLYCMSKKNRHTFSTHELMALVIAGVCHDLDHRGYNNTYFKEFNRPLAVLYRSSVMEEHHYKMATTILQLKGHNIFSFLSKNDYKTMMQEMYDAIIATDLANYFINQSALLEILDNDAFDIQNKECRKLCKAIMMTGADLCAIAKPLDSQEVIIEAIYTEFYKQGDEEKQKGMQPVCMLDRNNKNQIPKQEIDFIKFICNPLYTTLDRVIVGVKPLLEGTLASLALWQKLNEEAEKPSKSIWL